MIRKPIVMVGLLSSARVAPAFASLRDSDGSTPPNAYRYGGCPELSFSILVGFKAFDPPETRLESAFSRNSDSRDAPNLRSVVDRRDRRDFAKKIDTAGDRKGLES